MVAEGAARRPLDTSLLEARLASLEAENKSLKQRLAEASEASREVQRLKHEVASLSNSNFTLKIRLTEEKAISEALRCRLDNEQPSSPTAAAEAPPAAPAQEAAAATPAPAPDAAGTTTARAPEAAPALAAEVAAARAAVPQLPVGRKALNPSPPSSPDAKSPRNGGCSWRRSDIEAESATPVVRSAEEAKVRIAVALDAKERGNSELQRANHREAAGLYSRGLLSLRPIVDACEVEASSAAEIYLEAVDLFAILLLNLAQASIKSSDFETALDASSEALQWRSDSIKALFRRGRALMGLLRFEEAEADFRKVLERGPNEEAASALRTLHAMRSKGTASKTSLVAKTPDDIQADGATETATAEVEEEEEVQTSTVASEGAGTDSSEQRLPQDAGKRESGDEACSRSTLSLARCTIESVKDIKTQANESFKAGALKDAVQQYLRCIEDLRMVMTVSQAAEMEGDVQAERETLLNEARELETSLHSNCSVVYFKMKEYWNAIESASKVLAVRPTDTKALFCRGTCLKYVGETEHGQIDLDKLAHIKSADSAPEQTQAQADEQIGIDSRSNSVGSTGNAETSKPADATATQRSRANSEEIVDDDNLYDQALMSKRVGNEHFKKGDFRSALSSYRDALRKTVAICSNDSENVENDQGLVADVEQLSVALYLNISLCHIKLGEYEDAIGVAGEALSLQPDNVKGLFRRAQAAIARGRQLEERALPSEARAMRDEALSDLKAVLVIDPRNVEARREYEAARDAQKKSGTPSEGSAASDEGASKKNAFAGIFGSPQALRERRRIAHEERQREELSRLREAGNAAHRQGDYASAEQRYTEALGIDTTNTGLFLNRAAARLMLNFWDLAFEDCQEAAKLQPDSHKAYLRGAKCLQLQGKLDEAEVFLRSGIAQVSTQDQYLLTEQYDNVRSLTRKLGDVESMLNVRLHGEMEGRRAIRLLEQLEYLQPPASTTKILLLRALLQSRTVARAEEAEQLSEEILAQRPDSPECWYWRALALLLARKRKEALLGLRRCLTFEVMDSSDAPVCPHAKELQERLKKADALKDSGNALFNRRCWEEAASCYEDACKVAVGDAELLGILHTNICACLRRVEQRSLDAEKHAKLAIEANPEYAKAYFRRGVLHYDAGRWSQSLQDFKQASNLEPNLQGISNWLRRARHAVSEGKERKNHYKILGLLCECEQDEVKKKYRQLARECHPDKLLSASAAEKTAAEARFKAVNEAHEILGSAESRREYDFGREHQGHRHQRASWPPWGHGGFGGHHGGFGGGFGGGGFGGYSGYGGYHYGGFDDDDW
eukprot:TRINITY_DN26519_c0_g9_i1.p1 TRINITY_DN26519_c0_g9~~TRINITY_DN26519_c0_g9_i1.p1  ORF type:complete len:1305 (-),score=322.74 TRINITY_DN26519_c0_g9_i1:68-3982(-)